MQTEQSLETLRLQHRHLQRELDDELRRPHPDTCRILSLKKQKLALKDEITRPAMH